MNHDTDDANAVSDMAMAPDVSSSAGKQPDETRSQAVQQLSERNRFLEDSRKAVLNILEDISESEKKLRKQTEDLEKFRLLADTSFDHTVITDQDGIILYANHAAEILTGYSKEEMVGKTPRLWGKQMPLPFYRKMWDTIKKDKQPFSGELYNRNKNGRQYLASARIIPLLGQDGEVKFFVGVEHDITEERRLQLENARYIKQLEEVNLLREQQKERAEGILHILESIGEAVVATDGEERVIFMNAVAEKMTGWSSEKALHVKQGDLFTFVQDGLQEDTAFSPIREVLDRQVSVFFQQKTYLVQQTKRLPVSGTCTLLYNSTGEVLGTVMVLQDATAKYELDQIKNNFLSVAAHQLRTPLGSMRWSIEMLLNGDLGRVTRPVKDMLKQIYESSAHLALLVDDLLDVSRIDRGATREELKPVPVWELVLSVVKTLNPGAKSRGVTIITDKPHDPKLCVHIASGHMFEAFENLFSNAIKYSRPKGTVTVRSEIGDTHVVISIKDNGIGIPKDDQHKIFSKFFRAINAVRKETEGSGLGLSVVKSYVEESHGRIWFESQENVGTTFFVELPIDKNITCPATKDPKV